MAKKGNPAYSSAAMRWYTGIENANRQNQGLPPLKRMADDPGYKLFRAQSKANEKMFKGEAKRQRGFIEADKQRTLANLDFSDPIQLEQVRGGMEARGLSQSGESLVRQARTRALQEQQRAEVIASALKAASDLRSELAARIADQRQRKAQSRIDFRSQGYI